MKKKNTDIETGLEELRAVRRESLLLFWAVGVFSAFANLLMLAGPLYMLQVYDRVLSSRSVETLISLTVLLAFLYCIMGLLDFTRSRVLARIGARFQDSLDKRVFDAVIVESSRGQSETAQTGLSDLESIQKFISSPAPTAVFDIPWTPIFLIGISIFHPWLGYLAMAGGSVLVLLTLINQRMSKNPVSRSTASTFRANHLGDQLRTEAELVMGLGVQKNAFKSWQNKRRHALDQSLAASDIGGGFTALTKTFRLFLQSAMLGLGALLVLRGEMSPGAMIAGSILMGRALAPVELAIGQWPAFQRAQKGWYNLAKLLSETPAPIRYTTLPRPHATVEILSVTVIPPGQTRASLRMVNFKIEPGQAIGVIGPSASGKTTLARALTGTWVAAGGDIRLAGAALHQYDPERLGEYIGYLPQRVQLFGGTIGENIARLSPNPSAEKIVEAAKQADAHDMIVGLPDGYDTLVSPTDLHLSGGQVQRIGLARALYTDPVLLVLDEPNSNLDNIGSTALNYAIQRAKDADKAIVVMAHRPDVIRACDFLLVLNDGTVEAFGPRDEILQKLASTNVVQATQH